MRVSHQIPQYLSVPRALLFDLLDSRLDRKLAEEKQVCDNHHAVTDEQKRRKKKGFCIKKKKKKADRLRQDLHILQLQKAPFDALHFSLSMAGAKRKKKKGGK